MAYQDSPARAALRILMACAAFSAASAQADAGRMFANPPLLHARPGLAAPKHGDPVPLPHHVRVAPPPEVEFELDVMYTEGRIWDATESRYDAVRLRSYQGTGVDPEVPYTSPTIEVFPGQTIRLTLNNRLPRDASCLAGHHGNVNDPHCFNGNNLHTHGLWVNPAGNGDNVLISINPGVGFQYEYKLPPDHPAGTSFGGRRPTATRSGDIDTLLEPTRTQPFAKRILVLRQLQYACRDAGGNIKTHADGTYRCDPGDVGGIEGYDQLAFGLWPRSGRFTSINGLMLPTFAGARAGEVERWRVIHGGVRDTINLQFRRMKVGARAPEGLRAFQHGAYVSENCTGDTVPQHLIAADGLTLKAAMKAEVVVFQPAYRWDSLMVFPEEGVYCVIDDATASAGNVGDVPSPRQLLGLVEVGKGRAVTGDIGRHLALQLILAARANMPEAIWSRVAADLRNGLRLDRFLPHADIADSEVTGTQQLVFNIDLARNEFQVDGKPYDAGRIDRVLTLGGVDEWTLKSDFASHPFHIHINPFQIVRILNPDGYDVSAPDAVDAAGGTVDPQYRGLKGVWKGTLWVKSLQAGPSGSYTVVVRSRYRRYIGDFVLHCHILDHEDKGMMQNVRIALPDGAGGTSHGHH